MTLPWSEASDPDPIHPREPTLHSPDYVPYIEPTSSGRTLQSDGSSHYYTANISSTSDSSPTFKSLKTPIPIAPSSSSKTELHATPRRTLFVRQKPIWDYEKEMLDGRFRPSASKDAVLEGRALIQDEWSHIGEKGQRLCRSFRGKLLKLQEALDVTLSALLGAPVEELGVPLNGYRCGEDDDNNDSGGSCDFITVNVDELRKHCNKEHNLVWQGHNSAAQHKVQVQTFFRNRRLQRYFIVRMAGNDNAQSIPHEVADMVDKRLAEWKATQQAHEEKSQVMDAHVAKTDKTGWFKRTDWLEHFANRNLMHLAH
ncbi:hypothetical protein EJ02DRAFT_437278 [Clathrospora elynae]|uniref:Uncharacterized protein n=1 Tax=Clathrospora elynae TaxID=706981 RepID=A0A6A5SC69_9PLEO|nr:hypothetical protein EJ02DRAFT_437278 [Clathrospora elynae]